MTSFRTFILLLAAVSTAKAATVYDVGSAVTAGNTGANTYFVSNQTGAGVTTGSSLGLTVGTSTGTTNTTYLVGYFPDVSLINVGDSISMSLSFSGPINATNEAFRVGFYDSGNSQLTSNVTASNGSAVMKDYTGYSASLGANTTPSASNTFKERSTSNNNLFSSSSYNSFSSPTLAGSVGSTGSRNLTYTLELVATGVKMTIDYGTYSYSYIDTVTPYTNFDTFAIYSEKSTSTTTSPTLTFTNLTISSVPEPSTFVLCALGLGLLLRRRLRR
ncbi:PEP-CTERM protein-sorting domain-containing protein [Terrimicrobium sacchariphilum]|uniref:PEP-CTERM protein-sorting domain-containing protein n=1 Tax=Terrimicrobium sacchariphilum TaxID=690879 RepID=A0A146G4A0_TERSA|nr:PEP-CTERM sorting domain-containing protein [Terrimicrobium sacchariphilum]GAT32639.1 PEP-CTERM protein-sorting domain-containing protein [Terrimicrobium sacchariphilum]